MKLRNIFNYLYSKLKTAHAYYRHSISLYLYTSILLYLYISISLYLYTSIPLYLYTSISLYIYISIPSLNRRHGKHNNKLRTHGNGSATRTPTQRGRKSSHEVSLSGHRRRGHVRAAAAFARRKFGRLQDPDRSAGAVGRYRSRVRRLHVRQGSAR